MTVTLTDVESAALSDIYQQLSNEEAVHHILADVVKKYSEAKLGVLATQYRGLTPELQMQVIGVISQWYERATKPSIPEPDEVPETPISEEPTDFPEEISNT